MASIDSGAAYLAKPSADCCLEGHIHSGEPRGSTENIANINTYVVRPPSTKSNGNIILYFPDVWGFFVNGFLVMDSFADAGYLVVGLDYFNDDPVWRHRKDRADKTTDPGFDYEAWKAKHIAFADEHVPKWTNAIKQSFGNEGTKYACVGYCFGAPYVCDALASQRDSKPVCMVGAFAHPAFLKDYHFRNLERPLFLSCAEVDHTFGTQSRNTAVDMMIEGKKDYQLQLFSGVSHGFALRGDSGKPYERWVKEQSLRSIVGWFDFWLNSSAPDVVGDERSA